VRFSLIYPFYENQGMLELQLYEWQSHKSCDLIIIDDGSPNNPASDVLEPEKGLHLYRVKQDFPWHQHGCRNLGALVCETPFALFSDMDHMLRADDAIKLEKEQCPKDKMYMFQRVTAPTMNGYKPHPNSFLCSIDKYWESGGYDEDYCDPNSGVPMYGGDGVFIRRLTERTDSVMRHDISLVRYPREYVEDASTVQYERNGTYKENYRREFDRKRYEGDEEPKNPIRFQWERVI